MPIYYTMAELAKVAETPMSKAVYLNLLRQSPVLKLIPVEMVDAFKITNTRWQTLPTVTTRKLNGTYAQSVGTLEDVPETLFIYGGEFSIDRLATKVKVKENPLVTQTKMKTAAIAARFNLDWIANDHTIDPDGFEGLKKRISNQPARMTINIANGSAELDVLASAANEHVFIDAMHQALHYLGVLHGSDAKEVNVCAFMNETTKLGVGQVLRRLGLLDTTQDAYDRKWDTFGPAKLVDVGYQRDQATEIITNTEDPGDGGSDSSSMYLVRFGGIPVSDASGKVTVIDDDGVRLLQLKGTDISAYDPLKGAEQGAGAVPGFLRRIDWAIGLKQAGSYSAVRIKGFSMTA